MQHSRGGGISYSLKLASHYQSVKSRLSVVCLLDTVELFCCTVTALKHRTEGKESVFGSELALRVGLL